jgi:hypothetical protein
VRGEGVCQLGVDQFGQGGGVGVVADVPGGQPRQSGVGGAGAGLGHFGQAEVDGVGKYCAEEQVAVLGGFGGFHVGEVAGEPGPVIDFLEQVGDLDVGQHPGGAVDQGLGWLRDHGFQWGDLQALVGDDRVG